ncbi:hypothetical protein [Streptomyces dysideae]|uniref:hypothetical protein n=1 Tax=Streptomyces dysideae TaxID=909626 RepID=UPI000A517E92|nr:hypothetical protein [Streptomyces dysideae]
MAVTELSRSQLVRGLAAYHELAGEKAWPPLVWSFERGYRFCEVPTNSNSGNAAGSR